MKQVYDKDVWTQFRLFGVMKIWDSEIPFKRFTCMISNYCELSQKVGHLVTNRGSQTSYRV